MHVYEKYRGVAWQRRAILHAIGQSVSPLFPDVLVSDVMDWMRVSKPTAIKYLKVMQSRGEIIMSKEVYRANATIYKIRLSPLVKKEFQEGTWSMDFHKYCKQVLGITF